MINDCPLFPCICCLLQIALYWFLYVKGEQSMDIDAIFGTIRPVSVPRKSAIYVWGYNQSGQTGRKGKEDQLRIPKQLPPELFGCPAGTSHREC